MQPHRRPKSFAVRYRFGGQPRKLTLPGGLTLAAARKLAADALLAVEQGRDPAETKTGAEGEALSPPRPTAVAGDLRRNISRREQATKLRTIRRARGRACAGLVFPALGERAGQRPERSQLTRLFDKVEREHGTRRADLVLAYLRKIFHRHELRSDTFKSPIVKGMGRYSAKDHQRDRVLCNEEDVTGNCAQYGRRPRPGHRSTRWCALCFSLGCRPGEAAGLTWNEIVGGVWHLPARRNKTKKDLARPLSKAAVALVESSASYRPASLYKYRRPPNLAQLTKAPARRDYRRHRLGSSRLEKNREDAAKSHRHYC